MMFTPKMIQWLSKNIPGKTYSEAANLFNIRFNTSFTSRQIKGACVHRGIKAGRKGKEYIKPFSIGTEKIIDARTYVKISDKETKSFINVGLKGTWNLKHYLIWEEKNGSVPKGHIIIFADRNKNNFELNNLLLVSRRCFFYMCKEQLLSDDPEITKINLLITKHRLLLIDKVRKITRHKRHYSLEDTYRRYIQAKKKQSTHGTKGLNNANSY